MPLKYIVCKNKQKMLNATKSKYLFTFYFTFCIFYMPTNVMLIRIEVAQEQSNKRLLMHRTGLATSWVLHNLKIKRGKLPLLNSSF